MKNSGNDTRMVQHVWLDAIMHFLGFLFAHRRLIYMVMLTAGLVIYLRSLSIETRTALFRLLQRQHLLINLLLLFSTVTISLIWSAGQHLDAAIFLLFNVRGYHPHWLDHLMWAITQVGSLVFALILAGVFALSNERLMALGILLGMLTLWLLVETIKILTDRARPFLLLAETRIIGWHERGRSFPSGHTAQAFFLMSLLSHHFNFGFWPSGGFYLVALAVGFSRIYVGVHYPRDVVAGATLGAVWGILTVLVFPALAVR